jgi:hypothetical protein
VLVIKIQHEGSFSTHTQQMDADKVLEDPAGRGVLDGLPLLVWESRSVVLERLADAILQGSLHQQAHGHDHQQRHDPFGFLAIKGGGQKAWIFQEPKAAFCMLLAFIPREQFLGGQPVFVECIRGQDETTLGGDERLMGCERRGQSTSDMVHHLGRGSAWARAAPLAVARPRMDGALMQGSGLQPVHKGREGMLGIGGTGKGRAAALLPGLGFGFAVLQPVFVHAPLGLGLAMCGGAQHPALGYATVGGSQHVLAVALPQGLHSARVGVGQRVLGFGESGRDTGDPLTPRLGERLEVLGAREGAVCHKGGRAVGRLEWLNVRADDLSKGLPIVAMTT